jgi:hypothetical protein
MSYSPKVREDLVRKLYIYKHSRDAKPPMTKLVNEAVEEYLERKINEQKENNEAGSQGLGDNNRDA